MIKQTLKKISKLGYDIFWYYDPPSNAYNIRVQKGAFFWQHTVDFDNDLYVGGDSGFEFYMNLYLNTIFKKLEKIEEEKGANND